VSEKSARILRGDLGVRRPIFVVNPIVDVQSALCGNKSIAGRAETGNLTITTVARLIPIKGLDFLLEAFATLGEHNPGVELRIYGDGPLREQLSEQATRLGLDPTRNFKGSFQRGPFHPDEVCKRFESIYLEMAAL
jgi:glycosyltransferase involved in cell wall biosynthesis